MSSSFAFTPAESEPNDAAKNLAIIVTLDYDVTEFRNLRVVNVLAVC